MAFFDWVFRSKRKPEIKLPSEPVIPGPAVDTTLDVRGACCTFTSGVNESGQVVVDCSGVNESSQVVSYTSDTTVPENSWNFTSCAVPPKMLAPGFDPGVLAHFQAGV
jgi:hypothetical protein